MVRKTKEEAELTRKKLILAALNQFNEKGVAHTTLNDISNAAGVTKGAFYWHFKNKLEIFEAIFEHYAQPLDQQAEALLENSDEPLKGLFDSLLYYFSEIENSLELIALFSVSFFKCEYTDEFAPILKLDYQEILRSKDMVEKALARLPATSWQQGKPGDIELAASVSIDALIGTMTRWFRYQEGSLTEQALASVKLTFRGAGIIC